MIDIGSSRQLKINTCFSRRLEEVFTDDCPGKPEQELKIKLANEEKQSQNQELKETAEIQSGESDSESLLSKIQPLIQA
jgi:hypothetical protein